VGRDHPGSGAGADGHHPAGCIDNLVPIVKVQRDHVSTRVVVRQRGDLRLFFSQTIEECMLSFLQHLLSEYRKYATPSNVKLSSSGIDYEGKT
jgi:hypothetical protein